MTKPEDQQEAIDRRDALIGHLTFLIQDQTAIELEDWIASDDLDLALEQADKVRNQPEEIGPFTMRSVGGLMN